MYHKLAGMTGTAETEASEFWSIYKLDVVVIPTNRKVIRDDRQDLVYKTKREKYNAVIEEIVKLVEQGRPVLVGTTSVEISELLSRMLKLRGIKHNVLNAKQHQLEAQIVAEAGRSGQVTIATNMAGRGTDIKLTPEVKAAGGLAIIGTERHESRRVDRQLRGRAGRQGDPGSSQFFVSLEDDLMRLFGSGRIASMMDRMGLKEGEVIQAGLMTKAIERAQKKVEENNFGIRKRLLEYDDVMNSQREVIYTRRRHALYGERIEIDLNNIMYDYADNFVEENRGIEFEDFRMELIREVAVEPQIDEATYKDAKPGELVEAIVKALKEAYARRAKAVADKLTAAGLRVKFDDRDNVTPGWKFNEWELKGVPVRVEVGPRDLAEGKVLSVRRDTFEKAPLDIEGLEGEIKAMLDAIQTNMFEIARAFRDEHTADVHSMEELEKQVNGGYAKAMWCGDSACEDKLKDATGGVKSRCIPFKEEHLSDVCVCCGKPAKHMVYWGRQY